LPSVILFESTSATATTMAVSNLIVSEMSPLPCLPQPIHPMLILSLGGFFPITPAGTIVGKIMAPAVADTDFEMNSLLLMIYFFEILNVKEAENYLQ